MTGERSGWRHWATHAEPPDVDARGLLIGGVWSVAFALGRWFGLVAAGVYAIWFLASAVLTYQRTGLRGTSMLFVCVAVTMFAMGAVAYDDRLLDAWFRANPWRMTWLAVPVMVVAFVASRLQRMDETQAPEAMAAYRKALREATIRDRLTLSYIPTLR